MTSTAGTFRVITTGTTQRVQATPRRGGRSCRRGPPSPALALQHPGRRHRLELGLVHGPELPRARSRWSARRRASAPRSTTSPWRSTSRASCPRSRRRRGSRPRCRRRPWPRAATPGTTWRSPPAARGTSATRPPARCTAGGSSGRAARWTSQEHARTNAAVDATARKALFYNGSPAFTQFSASNGGAGSAGGKPYLANFIDPYDGTSGNPNSNWTVTLTADYLQSRYPQIGTLSGIRVNSRIGRRGVGRLHHLARARRQQRHGHRERPAEHEVDVLASPGRQQPLR